MDGKDRWARACRIAARRRLIDAPKLPVPQHHPPLPYGFASSRGRKFRRRNTGAIPPLHCRPPTRSGFWAGIPWKTKP